MLGKYLSVLFDFQFTLIKIIVNKKSRHKWRDFLLFYFSEIAAIPGKVFPSRYSNEAPPPVEM